MSKVVIVKKRLYDKLSKELIQDLIALDYEFQIQENFEYGSIYDLGKDDIVMFDSKVPQAQQSFLKKTYLITNGSKETLLESEDIAVLRNIMSFSHLKYFKSLFMNHLFITRHSKKDISYDKFFSTYKKKIFLLDKKNPKLHILRDLEKFLSSHFQNFCGPLFLSKQSFFNKVISCVDELLMNAIWDAHPFRSKLTRHEDVTVESEERVRVEIFYKDHEIIFSVQDIWGEFNNKALENLMSLALKDTQGISINYDSRGASIGLSLVLKCFKNILIHANKKYGTRVSFLVTNNIKFKELSKLGYTILSYQD